MPANEVVEFRAALHAFGVGPGKPPGRGRPREYRSFRDACVGCAVVKLLEAGYSKLAAYEAVANDPNYPAMSWQNVEAIYLTKAAPAVFAAFCVLMDDAGLVPREGLAAVWEKVAARFN